MTRIYVWSANPVIHWSNRPDPGFMNENFTRSEMKNYAEFYRRML